MTLARRLAAVERSLTPTQLVLRWLAEAHAHGSFDAYAQALLDAEPEDVPLTRLCREAERAARAGVRSRLSQQVDQAVGQALRETAFRFLLVLRINVTAHELLQEEQVYKALAPGNLALLAGATADERRDDLHRSWLTALTQLLLTRADALEAAQRARAQAEERYLDGCPALFPHTAAAWDEQLRESRELAAMALGLADLAGIEAPSADADLMVVLVERSLADQVEWAKVTALEKLGEGERGLAIARDWLRPKLERPGAGVPAVGVEAATR